MARRWSSRVAFTDLEDFTAYTEAEGDNAASRLLIDHHRESVAIVRGRGGRVLKWLGDGLMLIFPEPEAAVLACLDLGEAAPLETARRHPRRSRDGDQRRCLRTRRQPGQPHVTGSATGGQLVVTDDVRRAVGDTLGVAFHGPHLRCFKGVEEDVSVYVATHGVSPRCSASDPLHELDLI